MISFEPFRKMIGERKISTYYLRNKCGFNNIDSKTIKRLMTDQSVSTNTLNSICNALNVGLDDIIEFIPDNENETQEK